jgi:hypothetical protein
VAGAEGFSGVGRDGLLRAVAQLEAKVASLEDQVRERETWHAPKPFESDAPGAAHMPYDPKRCSTCASERIEELETRVKDLPLVDRAHYLRILSAHEAMLQTLTIAQTAGTEAQLGRQRARALLREVLVSGALTTSPPTPRDLKELAALCERIYEELGIFGQREFNDRAAKAGKS